MVKLAKNATLYVNGTQDTGSYIVTDAQGRPTSWVGKEATNMFRNRMILRGLEFEIKTGMRLTNKAPKCSTIIKKEFGLKGNPAKLLEQFKVLMEVLENPDAQGVKVYTEEQFRANRNAGETVEVTR